MRRIVAGLIGFLLLLSTARAAEAPGRVVQDTWNAAYLENSKAGFVHTVVHEVERSGQKLYRTVTTLELTIRRSGAVIALRMDTGSEETAEGTVTEVSMRQYQGNQQQLVLRGVVRDGQLEVTVEGKMPQQKKVRWNKDVLGLYRQERLFQDQPVKPGDQFSYASYEPAINSVVTNRVRVKDYEEVDLLRGRKRLLRVETVPDRIVAANDSVQLPGLITWLDETMHPVRSQFKIPQLGTLVLYRCNREEAQRRGTGATLPDIAETSLIPLNRAIAWPNAVRQALFRITVRDDDNPATTFATDHRQECRNVHGNSFDLIVRALTPPPSPRPSAAVKEEYLRSCYYLDSDNPQIQAYARQAIGMRTDPWDRAQAIERWVHGHMHLSYTESFLPASEVAKSLRGDCRQYGLLTTALCRAAGIPARTALGLCYAEDRQKGPVMAFHLWTEVWVRGEWVGLDATRGQGHVGATHLKIADSSWADTQSLTPLLPVIRVLDKLTIEVVRVDGSN